MDSIRPVMGDNKWRLVVPEATTNYVLNPSAETTGNFAAAGGSTVTRVTTYQKYGLYSYRIQTAGDNEGAEFTLSSLSNNIHYVTLRVRGTLPTTWDWSLDNVTYTQPKFIQKINTYWSLYGLQFPASQANGSVTLYIDQNGAGNGDFYIDGIQIEQKLYWTTYCDGNQDGCEWNGATNASTSTRSALSRAGGREVDIYNEYGFMIEKVVGASSPNVNLNTDSYAILPGGELNSEKIESRDWTLVGSFFADSESDLHDNIERLRLELSNEKYPGLQPALIRFNGSSSQREIGINYRGGLEGDLPAYYDCYDIEDDNWREIYLWRTKATVQLFSPDPFWYEIGNSAAVLDTNDSATFSYVAGRLKSTGQWDNLGPPNAAGTYTDVRTIAEDGTYVYIGGNFLNFDNIANADYIVRYNKQTGIYSALGTGMNNVVRKIKIGSSGLVYAVGDFTTASGGAANRIAVWNPVAETWSTLGTGLNARVYDVEIGTSYIYVSGSFTTAGGGAALRVARWSINGAAWSAMGAGFTVDVRALALSLDKQILYAGGSFTVAGGAIANGVIQWDIVNESWSALSSGVGGPGPNVLIVSPYTGFLYIAGDFTTPENYFTIWNGTSFLTTSDGVNSNVYAMSIGADNSVFLGGFFTEAGSLSLTDRITKWNGATYGYIDIDLPGTATVYSTLASKNFDPVVRQKYDLYIGFDTSGTGSYSGIVTATNNGSVLSFPKIYFNRSGGTSAVIKTLRNEDYGKEILLDYSMVDGETIIIDLKPQNQSVISSFFSASSEAVLSNSDLGSWWLAPGDNDITSFVDVTGAPTITAWMEWRTAYNGY